MKIYNISFAINKPYLLFCFVSIYSLIKNNKTSFFNIFIQHDNCFNDEDINPFLSQEPLKSFSNFKIHLLDCSSLSQLKDIEDGGKWTKEVYYKLFLPDLLPNVDKILYLDCDIIISSNIESYLDTPLGNYCFCGSAYNNNLNCGVLLINLSLLRKNNIHKEIFEIIKKHYLKDKTDFYKITEEYTINTYFKDTILLNNAVINISSGKNGYKENTNYSVIHYLGIKPWHLDRKIHTKFVKQLYIMYLDNLKAFAKNKVSKFLIISLYYFMIYGNGYLMNSFVRRIKNSVYKHIFKKPKYKYIHKGMTMSFIRKNSIN